MSLRSWKNASTAEVEQLARDWMSAGGDDAVGNDVVAMNFTAPPELQWAFIVTAVAAAPDDRLGEIAAGPMEHLLGWRGEGWIDRFEAQAAADAKFAKTTLGMWQYKISDPIWERVKAIQVRVERA